MSRKNLKLSNIIQNEKKVDIHDKNKAVIDLIKKRRR